MRGTVASPSGEARRAPDLIAATLIREIRTNVLPPGEALPTERALCERFAASRPTVREALARMQLQGYATTGAGRRPRAARPSLDAILRGAGDHIREILGDEASGAHLEQMRQFIETGAARAAAARADAVQLGTLQAALDRNREAIGTPDFAETDIAFHRALVAVVGNPVVLTLHDLFVRTMITRRAPTGDAARQDHVAFDEHRAIHQAILDADPAAAADVMDRHLARSWRARLAARNGSPPEA